MEDNRKKYYKKYKNYNNYNNNYYYYNKKKKKKVEVDNVEEVKTDLEISKGEDTPHKFTYDELVNSELKDNSELITDVKKNNKRLIFGYVAVILLLIIVLIGGTYAYFIYNGEDTRQADITGSDMYITSSSASNSYTITKLYPRTMAEARAYNDNLFTFTVTGKNTSSNHVLDYELIIENGDDVPGKTRIEDNYLMFDLIEVTDNNGTEEETYLLEGVPYSMFNYPATIPQNTSSPITRTFKVRCWVSEYVLISDTELSGTYTQDEYKNLFATIKVSVSSSDYELQG